MSHSDRYLHALPRVALVELACATAGCAGTDHATLRVATLNVAHGRGSIRSQIGQIGLSRATIESNLDAISGTLRREQPEVVALQEADGVSQWSGSFDHVQWISESAEFPHRPHGLHVDSKIAGARFRYGTAVLSDRAPVAWSSSAFDADPIDTKGFVIAEIEFEGRRTNGRPGCRLLRVVSVHLDFKTARTRKKQARMLIDALATSDLPLVVMGDFNCGWSDDDALRLICDELGLSAYQPEAEGWGTYPSRRPRKRLDWILISRQLRFVSYAHWPDRVSDHLGVMADLRWGAN